jgi:Arc/MetJ-type ribon-helix-helix transcriptional regulator
MQIRMTDRYANCMTQLVARVDDSLVAAIDDLVDAGLVASRSEAMRISLQAFVEEHRRRQIGERIAAAYRRNPQSEDELTGIDASTQALIEEEPW